jgi:transposase
MVKEGLLVKKVSCLLKRINCPRYLHHFGPKKYKFVQHAFALLLKETLKCSFRRISDILYQLGIKVPSYSALCKSRKRIPFWIWNNLLKLTAGETSGIIGIDGTGFSRTNPSFHYVKRIDAKKPVKRYAKLSALFDLAKKKFTALKVRMKPRHDMMDARPLVAGATRIKKLFGDSAYDAESLHEYCYWNNIQTITKPKKNIKRGGFRKLQMRNFSEEEYHQRSLIESGFGSLKRKYGGSVLAKKSKGVKTEIYCKAIAHNIGLYN